MIVTYRYRLLPTKRQHRALERILESQRQLYNAALEERIDAYRKAGVTRTYIDQTKALTEWRKSDSDASALPACLQRATLKRLDEAYKGFFRRIRSGAKAGFPRPSRRAVGVDLGIATFAALSDGGHIPSLKAARRAERRLRVAQRSLARKVRGSGSRGTARTMVARCHAAVARQRSEHLHQASARLVRGYDAIAIEKLNVKGLAAGALARDVHDASWARFMSMLRYKAEKAGARLIEVDPQDTSGMRAGENLDSASVSL